MARPATPLFGEILAAPRKLITVLKDRRGLSASLPEVLGAVGIGILLLGLVGFGIGAGINFAQDSGAKAALESVKSAQLLHQSKTNTFGNLDALTKGDPPALAGTTDNMVIDVAPDGRNYCALVESRSMLKTKYWIYAKSSKAVEATPTGQPPAAATVGMTCPTAVGK